MGKAPLSYGVRDIFPLQACLTQGFPLATALSPLERENRKALPAAAGKRARNHWEPQGTIPVFPAEAGIQAALM